MKYACQAMLGALIPYGADAHGLDSVNNACFGRALRAILPEDKFDRQPLVGGGGRFLLAADVRIDNRSELAQVLGVPPATEQLVSDASLLMIAWERWQLNCIDHLLGDVALAVWDSGTKRLTLARSPVCQKLLFYHRGRDFVAFASMPQALLMHPEIPKGLNFANAAAVASGYPDSDTETMFHGIEMVRHGEAIELTESQKRINKLWDLDAIGPGNIKSSEIGDSLRTELDRAVVAQMRRRSPLVACQLSSGRDSSAIVASAALALRGGTGRLLAVTGAPRAGYKGQSIEGRLADESELAAIVARQYPETTHYVGRSRRQAIGPMLRRQSEYHYRPITNPSALHWMDAIDEEARRQGATVMLNGSTGNYSISASGTAHLIDVLRQQGLQRWWQRAAPIGKASWDNWRNIGSISFGPFLPNKLYRGILRLGGRDVQARFSVPTLREPYRKHAEQLMAQEFRDFRPPASFGEFRRSMLLRRDNAELISTALYGFEVRDPTGDRRLIETCLSFPPDQLASEYWAPSPAYEAAFRDRIPGEVLYNRKRGIQGADWFEQFTKEDVSKSFQEYGDNQSVRELLDFSYIEQMVAMWPEQGTSDQTVTMRYRNQLLPALALADFIDLHFPD